MPIDFPSGPTTGQVYTYLGKSWVYNGTAWDAPKALSEIGAVSVFANAAARATAIPSPTNGIITYLNDSKLVEIFNSPDWKVLANGGSPSFGLVATFYYTSSSTFTKASFPWLRALRIKVQAAGGGGGGAATTGANNIAIASGGSGGAYVERLTSDIAGLPSSVTVTVGAGGTGGGPGAVNGNTGGSSSFGSLVSASAGFGGGGGTSQGINGFPSFVPEGAIGGTGDLIIPGGPSFSSVQTRADFLFPMPAGGSFLGASHVNSFNAQNGTAARGFGAGGTGGQNTQNQGTARSGGAGSNGIVIVELYA
jgi:hypothetical protein